MMQQQMLDVLVPHFNDPEGLALSLQSVALQSWTGAVRVIVCDDGSAPEMFAQAWDLVEGFDLPIIVLRNAVNRGRPFTRNVLLDAIESPFVAWLDAGDVWYPNKLERQFAQLAALEQGAESAWISCTYDWCWEGGRPRRIEQACGEDQIAGLLQGKNLRAYLWTLLGPAATFRTLGYFDERLPRLQDLDFFLRFILAGGTIYSANGPPLCRYNKSDIGRNADQVRDCQRHLMDKYRYLYRRYGGKFVRQRRFGAEMLAARFAGNNGRHFRTAYYLSRAALAHPPSFARHLQHKAKAQ